MTDPVKQPIAALLARWREYIDTDWLTSEEAADELEAAIAAQVALWDADLPLEPSCTCHRRQHIRDLQGKQGPEPR